MKKWEIFGIVLLIFLIGTLVFIFIPKEDISKNENNDLILKNTSVIEFSLNETDSLESNCPSEINYLYKNYTSYALNIQNQLEKEIGLSLVGKAYGGNEGIENKRNCGKVYFIMFHVGEWDSYRYWGIEIDAKTGKILKWEEVTSKDGNIDNSKLWWIQ